MNAPSADVGAIDRKTYIGGSDIAAILGLDPYGKTPLTVYLAKIGELGGKPDPDRELFLKRRKRFEEPIVAMLREEFAGNIVATNARYQDEEHPFMAAELDFEWADADGTVHNGEIKTVSPFAFNESAGWGQQGTDEIPIHYAAQVQWGLGIKRRDRCVVAALAGLDTMAFYHVERDEETIAAMRAAAVEFWHRHVLARVPPDPITYADAQRLYRRRAGRPIELDDETAEALDNLRQVRAELSALEGDKAELETKIAVAICKAWSVPDGTEPPRDTAELLRNGRVVATWSTTRGAYLDQPGLGRDHPDLKKRYTVEHYYRTFRFKK